MQRDPRTHASHGSRPSTHEPGPVSTVVGVAVLAVTAVHLATHPSVALVVVGTLAVLSAPVVVPLAAVAAVVRLRGFLTRLRDRVAVPSGESTATSPPTDGDAPE